MDLGSIRPTTVALAAALKINCDPGYRVYFGWDGKVLVILLGEVAHAKAAERHRPLRRWRDHKKRKRREG